MWYLVDGGHSMIGQAARLDPAHQDTGIWRFLEWKVAIPDMLQNFPIKEMLGTVQDYKRQERKQKDGKGGFRLII